MFENRLKWFSILLGAVALVIVARLAQIQIVRAAHYEQLASRILTRPVRYLPAVRGSILDRNGRPLVRDVPASDIGVHYAVLSGDSADYLYAVAREMRERGPRPRSKRVSEIVTDLRGQIAGMWPRLAQLAGVPESELMEHRDEIRRRVERIRESVSRRRGVLQPIAEEYAMHPVLESVDDDMALAVRMEMAGMPWIEVMPGARRVARDADALAHVLGRMGAVSAAAMERDPLAGQELRELRPGERCGIAGVERIEETTLRGTRGRLLIDFDGDVVERIDQQRGRDVTLTIDMDLQRCVFDILARHVEQSLHPAGGAAVVLDAQTREVLAMASYPTYSIERFNRDYDELAADNRRLPLMSRCVQAQYPPGSICKLAALYGALSDGLIAPGSPVECTGVLRRDLPNAFRCWIYNQYGVTHGPQAALDAIRNSCNIYFYTIGERLGPERLCDWFGRFGLGRTQGTGLIEETDGILPTPAWLFHNRGREPQRSDAWNFAIGQGEVTSTPLQAANAAAAVATGRWTPVQLVRDPASVDVARPPSAGAAGWQAGGHGGPPHSAEPAGGGRATYGSGLTLFNESYLRILRDGAWQVVNESKGTAHDAKLLRSDYVLCGKTGSAQTDSRPITWRYICEWPDGSREEVIADSRDDALASFGDAKPEIVGWRAHDKFPEPEEKLPSHAWFIGFTQSTATPRGERPRGRCYAIAVLIEYGGSGGRDAGPLARDVAEAALGEGATE
jgi:penicillin-binding protein 2